MLHQLRRYLFCSVLAALCASAGTLIPNTTIQSVQAFTGTGPTFTLGTDALTTDVLNLTVSGQVYLQKSGTNGAYGTNAAGVVITAGSMGVGQALVYTGNTAYGALLLGNSILGYRPLFTPSIATGLGSPTPPTTLNLTGITLASLGFNSTLPAGTILEFLIADTEVLTNSGSFTLSGSIGNVGGDVQETPEPATFAIAGASLMALGLLRARKR